MIVRVQSAMCALAGRSRPARRLMKARLLLRLKRAWLRGAVLREGESRANDVTVVIGVRDRSDYRLINALRSIREQTHLENPARTIVVDYGSTREHAEHIAALCRQHHADYVRTASDAAVWSRARALNVGIRQTTSRFVMVLDLDVVLSPQYLADCIDVLRGSPESVVCSAMLDLPEDSVEELSRAAASGEVLPIERWRARSSVREQSEFPGFHPSIAVAHTALFRLIRGYDEYFECWGFEDYDLMRRFLSLGVRPVVLNSGSFYLHQWHPKYEGMRDTELPEQIRKNDRYFKRQSSILRNGDDWGRTAAS